MFVLKAPIPLAQTTTILPSPGFGDSEGVTSEVNILRTVTGGRRTYVKSRLRRKLRWDFTLTRNKAIELLEFYRSYNASQIRIEDHNNRAWVGFIINNPFEMEMSRRGLPTRQDWPVGETSVVSLEFEGTLQDEDITASKIVVPFATSDIEVAQSIFPEVDTPFASNLEHSWDANSIVAADNSILSTWTDDGLAANDLIGTIGGPFDASVDRSPTYLQASSIFNSRPVVSFEDIPSALTNQTAAMRTTSNTQLFPSRRGTIFWVFAHTIDDVSFASETEFGVWSLKNTTGSPTVEQVHMAGASSPFFPVNVRFNPADAANDIRLATINTSPVPSRQPFIYMLSRDSDTNLRFRTNGVEREGSTILNNIGYTGRFHVNDQKFTPQFDARIRGQWGQIMVYKNSLNTSDIQTVERYLSLRWGVPLFTVPF